MYYAFTRTWWTIVNGVKIPSPGKRTTIGKNLTRDEALKYCKDYNDSNDPGPLSRKAEFDKQ